MKEDNYDPTNVLQVNLPHGLRVYRCKKCKTKHYEAINAGCCCADKGEKKQ